MIGQALRQSAAYGGAVIFYRASLLVQLVVLSFLVTPRDYGALGMIVTVTALVTILVPAQIGMGLVRYFARAPEPEKKLWASSAFTFLLLSAAAFLVGGQILAEPFCVLVLGDPGYLPTFRIALFLMVFTCIFTFFQNQFRWEFRTAGFVLITVVFSISTIGLSVALAVLVDPPLFGVILGQSAGAAAAIAIGAFGLRRSLSLLIERDKLRAMLAFSVPLVPANLALLLNVHASRLVLNGLTGLEEVGLYTLATQIAGIAMLGIVGVGMAVTPLVMTHHEDPGTPGRLARLFEGLVGYAIIVCLLLGLFAPEAIGHLGNRDYAGAAPLVLPLAPALLMTQMYVCAPGFLIAKRTVQQMWVSIASTLVNVIASFALIPVLGLAGAAAATLVSATIFLWLWFALSQRLYPVPVRWSAVALAVAAGALLGAAGQSVPYPDPAVAIAVKTALVLLGAAVVFLTGMIPLRASIAAVGGAISARRVAR